jgi:hypothetical protein
MKTVLRYRSQLLFRRSYKPARGANRLRLVFRPSRPVSVPVRASTTNGTPATPSFPE